MNHLTQHKKATETCSEKGEKGILPMDVDPPAPSASKNDADKNQSTSDQAREQTELPDPSSKEATATSVAQPQVELLNSKSSGSALPTSTLKKSIQSASNRSNQNGGFPMSSLSPSKDRKAILEMALGMAQNAETADKASSFHRQLLVTGSFPLPKLHPTKKTCSVKPYSFQAYERTWTASSDKGVARELLSRRLHRGKPRA